MADRAAFVPAPVRMAAKHVGASAREPVDPTDFLRALGGQEGRVTSPAARRTVEAFLHEADPAKIVDLVACGATNFDILFRLAEQNLPPDHPNRLYLHQLAA